MKTSNKAMFRAVRAFSEMNVPKVKKKINYQEIVDDLKKKRWSKRRITRYMKSKYGIKVI